MAGAFEEVMPLVGRDRELARLRGLVAAATRGQGGAAVVLGEAGIGKTALVEALRADAAAEGVQSGWGCCTAGATPAFWPWRLALRQVGLAAVLESSGGDRVGAARSELFARVVDELATLEQPVVFVLEDVHWADPGSLLLLRFVAGAAPGLPLLLIATARDDPGEASVLATEVLRSLPAGVHRIVLAGLDPSAVAVLVAQVIGYQPDPDVTRGIVQRCGGNPYFVGEVSRLYASRGPAAELAVPPGVQQVLERRLARLSPRCRDLLAASAVLDEPAPELVADMVHEPVASVLAALGEAEAAGLLVSDARGLRFAHALVRDAVYVRLPPAVSARLHQRAAEAVEQQAATAGRATQADGGAGIAAHWRRVPGDRSRRRAASWALTAARHARRCLAFEQAAEYYAWALEDPAEDELTIRIEQGEAQILAGALTAGRATLWGAAREAHGSGRPEDVARAVLATGVGGFEVAMFDDEQIVLLEEALPHLEHDDALRAAVMARLSLASAERRSTEDRIALAEESIALARAVRDNGTEVTALAAWCDALPGPDHSEARLERLQQMIVAAARSGDPANLLLARRLRLVALAERGEFAAVDAEIAAYAKTADRLRLPLYLWLVPIWRGARALMSGHLDATRRHLAEAERLTAEADSINAAMLLQVLKTWLHSTTGEHDLLAAAADRQAELLAPYYHDVDSMAGLQAMAGRHEKAREMLHRRMAIGVESMTKDSEYLSELWLYGEAAIALGEPEAAAPVYRALEPYAHRWMVDGIFAGCPGIVAHQLGRLAALLGDPDGARRWLEQARDAHKSAGASPLVTRSERALAAVASRRPGAPASREQTRNGELRRSARLWHARWGDVSVTLPALKGIADLAVLLAAPETDVHVLDLVEAAGGAPAATVGGHVGEQLDDAARAAYRDRLVDLEAELAEAEANADTGRLEALRTEQELLLAELTGALGLGGRPRTTGDPVERARAAVTMRIRTALKAIGAADPALARHLERSVRTGRFCSYRPEVPTSWTVQR